MVIDAEPPRVSVVIPTYNRAGMLRTTLEHLTRQHLPVEEFEVVVADDGSSDDTRAVVESFAERLRLKYYHQPDLGFRAGAARNGGARLATAPVLVFLDTGPLFGPDYLANHLAAHQHPEHRAVIGYAYGYNPEKDMSWLNPELARLGPEATVARYADDPAFRDIRHPRMDEVGFDLSRGLAPWQLFFTINCSVRAEDFHAVGGFDGGFTEWGAEDLEFAFKLFGRGVKFHFAPDAWVVDVPHPRDMYELREQLARQVAYLLTLHREPVMEIGYALTVKHLQWSWEADYADLLAWQREVGDRSVADELVEATSDLPPAARVAVFGSGGDIPPRLSSAVVLDFDSALVRKAAAGARHHALGLRTPLEDGSVDVVVITSRLAGLWDRWSDDLLAEARRIGREVRVFPGATAARGSGGTVSDGSGERA
ncbi:MULTISPECIES: glycosyltransferase [Saccharothrix]|uniref:glycosyltransferase n=1 Tax=Saccharothrix TaxID=2071 RepID=UPI0009399A8B|nr:glycosyltransferase [Saccharothrix sp. CB00851]